MQIEVQLFAAARQLAGTESVRLQLPAEAQAAELLDALGRQIPALHDLLPSCRLAIDCRYAAPDDPIDAHQEIALIPPVSGG